MTPETPRYTIKVTLAWLVANLAWYTSSNGYQGHRRPFLAFAAFWIDVLIMDEEGGREKMHMSRGQNSCLVQGQPHHGEDPLMCP